jgi:uncharacterized membrane protein YvbJ
MKICPSCSTQNNDSAKFCPSCGKSLNGKTELKPKKKLSKLKRIFVGIASFIGFLAVLYLALFLYVRVYIDKNFAFAYMPDGTIDVIGKKDISALTFDKLIICESVDENTNAPINAANEFKLGTRKIYASIKVTGASINDSFKFVWKYANTKNTIIEYSGNHLAETYYFSGYEYSYLTIPESGSIDNYKVFSEPGDYMVEFYHNGVLVSTEGFKIVK